MQNIVAYLDQNTLYDLILSYLSIRLTVILSFLFVLESFYPSMSLYVREKIKNKSAIEKYPAD